MQAIPCSSFFLQFRQVCEAMKEAGSGFAASLHTTEEVEGLFAKELLDLKQHYHAQNPLYFECIRQLTIKNAECTVVDFLKATPPAHLSLQKLQTLFELTLRVYRAHLLASKLAEELASSLFEITRQEELLQISEKRHSTMLRSAVGGTGGAIAGGLINPWLAPLGFFIGSSMSYAADTIARGKPLLHDRPRRKELQFIPLSDYVRFAFEPESSGYYGRYIAQIPSQTLGEVHIDLQGEPFIAPFNLSARHKIDPSVLEKLCKAMQRRLREKCLDPAVCLSILETVQKGSKHLKDPFLDQKVALCFDHMKELCKTTTPMSLSIIAPTPETILDVPTYHNSCGLYSLALGVIRASKRASKHTSTLPAYFIDWPEEYLRADLRPDEVLKDEIHKILRIELVEALLENVGFKQRRKEGFSNACLQLLCNEPYPIEMEALVESNLPFMERLRREADPERYRITSSEQKQLLERCTGRTTTIEPKTIAKMVQVLEKLSQVNESSFYVIVESFFNEVPDPIDRIIMQQKLLSLTWMAIRALEQRLQWLDLAKGWLEDKLFLHLQHASEPQKIALVKLVGLLQSVNFEGHGDTYTVARSEFIESQCLQLLIASKLKSEWESLYKNYLNYVKDSPYMLTADELLVLADKWNVDLKIHEWSKKEALHPTTVPTKLKVYITNPKMIHWQVYS